MQNMEFSYPINLYVFLIPIFVRILDSKHIFMNNMGFSYLINLYVFWLEQVESGQCFEMQLAPVRIDGNSFKIHLSTVQIVFLDA